MTTLFNYMPAIDWLALTKIIGIDIMLGVDNALMIALACASLPEATRKKAILYGTAGAVGLRAVLLVFASVLIHVPYLKIAAGAYLVYVGIKLLLENEEHHQLPEVDGLIAAVKTILVADFMMSLDNVMGVTAAAQTSGPYSNVYAIAGVVISIPIIVFAANGLTRVMQKVPLIVWGGAGLLGWVGVEMMMSDPFAQTLLMQVHTSVNQAIEIAYKSAGFFTVVITVFLVERLSRKNTTHQG